MAWKRGSQSKDVFELGDPVRVQDHMTKRWTTKGKIVEVWHGGDGKANSFQVESESGRVILRHCNHLRHKIRSTDRVTDTQIQLHGSNSIKEF